MSSCLALCERSKGKLCLALGMGQSRAQHLHAGVDVVIGVGHSRGRADAIMVVATTAHLFHYGPTHGCPHPTKTTMHGTWGLERKWLALRGLIVGTACEHVTATLIWGAQMAQGEAVHSRRLCAPENGAFCKIC